MILGNLLDSFSNALTQACVIVIAAFPLNSMGLSFLKIDSCSNDSCYYFLHNAIGECLATLLSRINIFFRWSLGQQQRLDLSIELWI